MSRQKSWYSVKALAGSTRSAEISIHDEIGLWGVRFADFAKDVKALGELDSLQVSINSPGGEVFDGLAIYNFLRNHPATVLVRIEGIAASMASVIAMAGDEIRIPENALMMVHNPWGVTIGDSDEMRKMADVLDKLRASLVSAYRQKTGLSDEEITALLDEETWMSGREAVEKGFADTLTDEVALAASVRSFDMRAFAKMPAIPENSATAETTDPAPVEPEKAPEPQDGGATVEPPAPDAAPETAPAAEPQGFVQRAIAAVTGATRVKAELETANATISSLTRERDEARAEVAQVKAQLAGVEQLRTALAKAEGDRQTAAQLAAAVIAAHGFTPAKEEELPKAETPRPVMTRAAFEQLDHASRNEFFRSGGKLSE